MASNTTQTSLSFSETVFLITFTSLQIIIGTLANGVVIVTFLVARELRTRPSDLLILNLAVADLISLLTFLPLHLYMIKEDNFEENLPYLFYESFNTIGSFSSGITIFSIAVDKFLAVAFPLRYKNLITRNIVFVFIAISWIVAVLLGIVNFLSYILNFYFIFLALWTTFPLFLLITTTLLYCFIFSYAIKQGRKVLYERNISNEAAGRRTIHRYRVVSKMVLNSFVLVCLFHGTFLPMVIYFTHFSLVKKIDNSRQLSERIWIYSFVFLNSCINPIIYTCGTRTFKKAFRRRIWSKIISNETDRQSEC